MSQKYNNGEMNLPKCRSGAERMGTHSTANVSAEAYDATERFDTRAQKKQAQRKAEAKHKIHNRNKRDAKECMY